MMRGRKKKFKERERTRARARERDSFRERERENQGGKKNLFFLKKKKTQKLKERKHTSAPFPHHTLHVFHFLPFYKNFKQ